MHPRGCPRPRIDQILKPRFPPSKLFLLLHALSTKRSLRAGPEELKPMDGKPFEPKRGWDVGDRPTVPMPYFRLPEHKFVEAHLRRAPPGAPELRRPPECRDLEFSSREPHEAHVEMHARREYQRRPGEGWLSKLHPKTLDYRTAAHGRKCSLGSAPARLVCLHTGHAWRPWAARYSQAEPGPLGPQPKPPIPLHCLCACRHGRRARDAP